MRGITTDASGGKPATEAAIEARAQELKRRFEALGITLAAAESCTGGGLANAVTDVPGSSSYFLGGIVAYSNKVKERLLGVDPETLAEHGAVSEPVALAMAEGARYALRSDVAVGITGVAGPDGGTVEKPVGLVYIGLATVGRRYARRYLWSEDRAGNKRRSVEAALEILLAYTEGPLP